jgi:hypothetical protein
MKKQRRAQCSMLRMRAATLSPRSARTDLSIMRFFTSLTFRACAHCARRGGFASVESIHLRASVRNALMADIVDSSSVAFFHVCRMIYLADVDYYF